MSRYHILATMIISIAIGNLRAQNIAEIAKSDPLIITGAVGTQSTYYHSSAGNGSMSPFNSSIYANLNLSVYGINMPFSFAYYNNNTSFSYPHFTFDISPSYKNWTLHLGRRSMPFSNYVYNIPFYGVGIEYRNPQKKIRFGAFYGQLKKAINDDPTDPTARNPQYERRGWGLKLGYGSGRNYLDLYFMRAKDRIASLDDRWFDRILPQENIAVGLRGRITPCKFLTFNANVAASLFSTDLNASLLETAEAQRWDKIFDTRNSSLYRFAGDLNMSLTLKYLNLMLSYKMVQPNYMTLGINYTSNNLQSLGASANTSLFRQRLSLSATFSGQEDNLSGEQLYTTRGFVYAANANLRFTDALSLNAAYNGYLQRQYDGMTTVNDTTRINRRMESYTLSPNYSFGSELYGQSVGISYNYSRNIDLNPFNDGGSDVNTQAVGASYNIDCSPIETDFNMGYNYQTSSTRTGFFKSQIVSFGASRSFLKSKKLMTSANLSASWNEMDSQRTFSVGAYGHASYMMGEAHAFGLSASVNKYNDFYVSQSNVYSGFDFSVSFNYNYTFTLVSIKNKAHRTTADAQPDQKKQERNALENVSPEALNKKKLFKKDI